MPRITHGYLSMSKGDDDGQHAGGSALTEARSGSQRGGQKHRGHAAARRRQGGLSGHRAAAGAISGRAAGQRQ